MPKKLCGFVLACALAGATPAQAQGTRVELGPYAGVFVPVAELLGPVTGLVFLLEGGHRPGPAFGGRITAWLPGPVGLEGLLTYALSDVETGIFGAGASEKAYVLASSARLVLRIGALDGPASLLLGFGAGYVTRGGEAYTGIDKTGDIGYSGGIGVRIKVSDRAALRVDADDYLYAAQLTVGTTEVESRLQVDFVFSVGLAIGLGGS